MDEAEAAAGEVASVEAAIGVPAVLFNIAQLWKPGMDENALYEVTHGYWRVGIKREQADYALAVAGGHIRAAFRVLAWRPRRLGDRGWEHDNLDKPRWGFEAEPAPELTHLIGLDIKALFPQGASNPVRYVNCDVAPSLRVKQLSAVALPPVDELEQLRAVCQRLQANPVLHMSLHSKELFHSNFLAWLVEAHPDLGEQVLKPWLEGDAKQKLLRVRRETHHLDIVIELPGCRPLVIENKVFSLPYMEQLTGYDGVNLPEAGLADATRVLLSLPDPGWATWKGWTWVSYDVLAERLESHVSTLTNRDAFAGMLLQHYVSMVRDLLQLARLTGATGDADEVALDGDQVELLRPLRLHDVMQKLRARQILLRLEEAYRKRRTPVAWTEVGMANGSVLMSTALTLDNGDELGWQLQGAQWRRFLITATEGRGAKAKADRADYAADRYSSWFDFTAEQELGPFVEMPKVGFNHFDPSFVYRYLKVPALKLGELLTMSVQVVDHAASFRASREPREQVDELR